MNLNTLYVSAKVYYVLKKWIVNVFKLFLYGNQNNIILALIIYVPNYKPINMWYILSSSAYIHVTSSRGVAKDLYAPSCSGFQSASISVLYFLGVFRVFSCNWGVSLLGGYFKRSYGKFTLLRESKSYSPCSFSVELSYYSSSIVNSRVLNVHMFLLYAFVTLFAKMLCPFGY